MEKFVRGFLAHMGKTYPANNYLTWHNHGNEPQEKFNLLTQTHFEVDIPCGSTEGYELLSFHSGQFVMDGDRGWINWGFGGNYTRDPPDGPFVEFHPLRLAYAYMMGPVELIPPDYRERVDQSQVRLPAWNATLQQKSEPWKTPAVISGVPVLPADLDAIPVRAERPAAHAAKFALTAEVSELVNDGTYFVHCSSTDDTFSASGVAYYYDLKPGQNIGQLPDDFVWVDRGHSATFRQSVGAVEFLGGEAGVHWNIFGGGFGSSTQPGRFAGIANDGLDHFFLYTDAGQELFATSQYTCFSQYYAF